jgi:hypothetical protein
VSRPIPGAVLVLALVCGLLLVPGVPAGAQGTAPLAFKAHYTADWKSFNVGSSDLELVRDATPGRYRYTWSVTARGIFRIAYPDDVIQKSWFSVAGGHVRPDKYRAEEGNSTASIDFDWTAGRAHGVSEKKPVDLKLSDGVQDVLSIQVEIMLDLKNDAVPKTFRVLDKDEIKDFVYANEGPARIRTALGELDTVIVSSRRAGGNRILRMWFAPSLGFVPVQAERSRDGRLEFAMKIKTLQSAAPPAAKPATAAP